jgi:nucleoside-diphosphate-sugar epimerase
VALRYFNVFGPRQDPLSQYAAVIPRFISAFLDGAPPIVFGDGEQSRDFTYVENVTEVNLLAANAAGVSGGTFNVACGERASLNEIIGEPRELTGRDIAPIQEDPRPGDVRHSMADISSAQRELGYEPAVDVRVGLKLTLEDHERRRGDGAPLSRTVPQGLTEE